MVVLRPGVHGNYLLTGRLWKKKLGRWNGKVKWKPRYTNIPPFGFTICCTAADRATVVLRISALRSTVLTAAMFMLMFMSSDACVFLRFHGTNTGHVPLGCFCSTSGAIASCTAGAEPAQKLQKNTRKTTHKSARMPGTSRYHRHASR